MKRFLKIFKWLFAIGSVLGLVCAVALFVFVVQATKDLPSLETLEEYKPAIMSRVHAGDGKLISEFRTEARVFVPIETIPQPLQHAFVAAEDQRFYKHTGFDLIGFTRAMVANIGHVIKDERLEGGSTLTQQVAKNFLVGNERKVTRKIREVFIARRIERAMDKDHILELYLNEIYFGNGAYGVAAASLNYFGKPMKDLSLEEMAYLAVLPKAPNNYQVNDPEKKKRALFRRNYVLTRMIEDGYADKDAAEAAKETDIITKQRLVGEQYLAADYFVEEARKKIYTLYGQDELYSGGLSIRTTLDTDLQLAGRQALRKGLEGYDRRHGYRGPLASFDTFDDWKTRLADFERPKDISDWRVALVLEANGQTAELAFADGQTDSPEEGTDEEIKRAKDAERGTLALSDITWAVKALSKGAVGKKLTKLTEAVNKGDVILVQRKPKESTAYNLRQMPKINGGLIAMDPHTGRILALVGGYSFEQNQFNRATQAKRQPGSAFKPFVYAAALDNGYTPASQVLDAPFVIERQDIECEENEEGTLELRDVNEDGQLNEPLELDAALGEELELAEEDECERFYKPSNYNTGKFYGLSTLRLGLEKSRNAMTVRLANDIGMTPVNRYARALGIYDETKPELAWALGAGETSLLRLASAYSSLVNGGKKVTPSILDRVQDGKGKTVYSNTQQSCEACAQDEYVGQSPPELPDLRDAVLDPVTAYQVTFMLKGVVDNGTGKRALALNRPVAGKTGTTNDSLDTWFMGFSPDLVVGVYVGMDIPEELGRETGSSAAAPIFVDFMAEALKSQPKVPFRIPEGVTLSPVNRDTGEPSYIGAPNFILEAFRPGTEPRLGDLKSTIRVGSGGDSFGSYNYDFDDTPTPQLEAEADIDVNVPALDEIEIETDKTDGDNDDNQAPKNAVQDEEGASDKQAETDEPTETPPPALPLRGLRNAAQAPDEVADNPPPTSNDAPSAPPPGRAVQTRPLPTAPVDVVVKTPPAAPKDLIEENLDDGLY